MFIDFKISLEEEGIIYRMKRKAGVGSKDWMERLALARKGIIQWAL